MRIICGVDPGKTTGVCVLIPTPDRLLYDAFEILDQNQVVPILTECFHLHPHMVFAVERYQITSRTTQLSRQPAALEVIGGIRQMVASAERLPNNKSSGVSMEEQNKSDAQALVRPEVLHHLGIRIQGMPHARDAAIHAVYRLSKTHLFHVYLRGWG